jgi:hypothetical protein
MYIETDASILVMPLKPFPESVFPVLWFFQVLPVRDSRITGISWNRVIVLICKLFEGWHIFSG